MKVTEEQMNAVYKQVDEWANLNNLDCEKGVVSFAGVAIDLTAINPKAYTAYVLKEFGIHRYRDGVKQTQDRIREILGL